MRISDWSSDVCSSDLILDAKGDRLVTPSDDVEVNYREFVTGNLISGRMKASVGWDHGVLVATAVARQIRELSDDRPVRIYAANAFFLKGVDENNNPKLGIDFEGAKQAIDRQRTRLNSSN